MISSQRNSLQDRTAEENRRQSSHSIRRNVGEITRDAVQLAEYQLKLIQHEAQSGARRLVVPIVILAVAFAATVAALPVGLILVAQALIEFTSWGPTSCYAIAFGIGIACALISGSIGVTVLRRRISIFSRSMEEFSRNVQWFKCVIDSRGKRRPVQTETT